MRIAQKEDNMESIEKYLSGLTEAQMDEAEKIEAELNALVAAGFSERTMLAFVKTIPAICKLSPAATVEGIFEQTLLHGLNVVLYSLQGGLPPNRQSGRLGERNTKRSGARLVR
jgi:hypothetical protein